MNKRLLVVLFLLWSIKGWGQIVVTSQSIFLAQSVINTKFLSPSGVFPGSVQNVSCTSGFAGRFATFTGTSNIGFTEGIILSTGNTLNIPNPAGNQVDDGNNCGPNYATQCPDVQLQSLTPGNAINDVTILEFDFQPLTDTVKFEYVFASEEYPEYVCNFNDVFGFFVTGPNPAGGNYVNKNFALIPGTNLPVSVNSINPGTPGAASGGGTCSGPGQSLAYSSLYTNNTGSTIIFDGFTKVLSVTIPVNICSVYHLKMGIANAKDGVFESAVFLKAYSFGGSFNIPITASGGSNATTNGATICPGDTVTLCAPNSYNYLWSGGATTQCINVVYPDTGNYGIQVLNPNQICFASSGTLFHVGSSNPDTTVSVNGPLTLCPGDSVQLTANAASTSYTWSNGAGTQSIWVNAPGTYNCTFVDTGGCGNVISETVAVYSSSVTPTIVASSGTTICPGATVTLNAFPPGAASYLWSNGATSSSINATVGNYTVTVGNGTCSSISLPLSVSLSIPNISISSSGPLSFCQGGNTILIGSAGFQTYLWNTLPLSSNDSVTVNTTGLFQLIATDSVGCKDTATVNVTMNNASASITALTDSILCPGDSIQLFANPAGGISYDWLNNGLPTGLTGSSIWVNAAGSYSVDVQNANTCHFTSSPVNIYMSSSSAAIVSPAADTTICIGTNISVVATGGGTYQWSTGAITAAVAANALLTNIYTVTVTATDLCKHTRQVKVTVSDPQVTISTTDPLNFCQGSNAIINASSASFASYNWSTGITGSSSITVSQTAAINLTVTDSVGCIATSNTLNTQMNIATAQITVNSDNVICPNEIISMDASPANGLQYTWSNGATSASINISQADTFTVTITNANGCIATAVPVIITQSSPAAAIIPQDPSLYFCPGATFSLTANNGLSYAWSTGATSQLININAPGLYTVTVTNSDTCSAVASLTVSQSIPVANITNIGDTTFCKGSSVTLNANTGSAWLWSNGETDSSVVITNAGMVSVTVTDLYGCSANTQVNIVVNEALAVLQAGGTFTFCTGDSIQLTETANPTHVWSNGAASPSIWVNNANIYYVVVTDVNGCKDTSDLVYTNLSIPQATISPSGNVVICQNAATVLTAYNGTANNNQGYQWSDNTTSSTNNAIGNGNYTVTVTITDSIGCKATSAAVNIITSIPVAQIVSPLADTVRLCPNQSATLQANFGSGYLWSNGSTADHITVGTEGSYAVTVADSIGCLAQSNPIYIDTLSSFAVVTVNGPIAFCQGGDVTITVVSPGTYQWSNGATSNNITVSNNGTYNVAVTNPNGCVKTSDPVVVTVHDFPLISFTVDSSSECEAFKILFRNQSTFDNGSTFHWSFGDGDSSIKMSPVHWYTVEGEYVVVLTIISPYGCTSSDSSIVQITRFPDPVAAFTTSTNIESVFGGPISFTNASINAVRFHWDFGDQSGSTEVNPLHNYREPGYYKVVLTAFNPADCEDKEHLEITVSPIYIPSAFTPNGDGKNEVFPTYYGATDISDYEFIVWDRWGQQIFISTNPTIGWNGNLSNGDPATIGVYMYQLRIADQLNKDFSFKGKFSLIR